jgi:hypothetical protein
MTLRRLLCVPLVLCGSGCLGTIGSPTAADGDPAIADECGTDYAPGRVPIHRLTNDEYNNTVRDLLFTSARPADRLPPVTAGISGFTNDSDHLNVYDELVFGYYDAAESLAHEVLASKGQPGGAWERLVTCAPSRDCAAETLSRLGRRAWRRPLTSDETSQLVAVFDGEPDFDSGLEDALVAMLVSPKFIFNSVAADDAQKDGVAFAIGNDALASRLSYFLWQSMPDDELFTLADAGALTDRDTLAAQVRRMLKDEKAGAFVAVLRNEWAGLASLATPAATRPGLDDNLRRSMVGEVDTFIKDVVDNDRSLMTLVSGNYSFVDRTLADYYGIPFSGSDPSLFVREDQSPNHRRGLIATAAIMTATAGDVAFTHPVKRGKWVTSRVLCTEPPPPPPGIPTIDFNPAAGGTAREKLAAHTAAPACAGCHVAMDAVGLGLENFGTFGEWRNVYAGSGDAIDASGTLPSGAAFTQPFQMLDEIAADDATRACLARQVMSYALTRALTSTSDKCVAKAIGRAAVTDAGSLSSLIVKIVTSHQFQMQTGEAP